MLDVDEFIVLSNLTLRGLLAKELPNSVAAIQLPISWYSVNCPSGFGTHRYEGYDVFSSRIPDQEYFTRTDRKDWYMGGKSIIRPANVLTQHVHNPLAVKPNVHYMEQIDPQIAAMKHVRCGSWQ